MNKAVRSLFRAALQQLPCAATPIWRTVILEHPAHRPPQRGFSPVDAIGRYQGRREDRLPGAAADRLDENRCAMKHRMNAIRSKAWRIADKRCSVSAFLSSAQSPCRRANAIEQIERSAHHKSSKSTPFSRAHSTEPTAQLVLSWKAAVFPGPSFILPACASTRYNP